MNEAIYELLKRHFPVNEADVIHCTCGARFWKPESWARHVAEEIELSGWSIG